ncbi:SGNH hydrolase-type esterase domain-containing protein [Powellomyces hirtus]|nr:SGNH hydrolase-type esterase domain-containing protein [Powellomyces hirtus]
MLANELTKSGWGKWKERSATTHTEHLQQLQTKDDYGTLLLGDSMLERFKTTGSETVLNKNETVFNAGVGGDKVENVIYRVEEGLFHMLPKLQTVFLHVGTNNFGKRTISKSFPPAYKALLSHIRAHYASSVRIYITGLFQRTDVDAAEVNIVNDLLETIARDQGCVYVPPFPVSLDDHIHMDSASYSAWDPLLSSLIGEERTSTEA